MRAILEFQLPEDSEDHRHALKGSEYWCAIFELDQELRSIYKHTDKTTVDIDWLRTRLNAILYGE